VPSAIFTYPRTANPGPGPSVGWVGLDVGVGEGTRVCSTVGVRSVGVNVGVRVGGGGVIVGVDVCVVVGVLGRGVGDGVRVSAAFVDVGRGVAGEGDNRQAARARTKMKSECLNIMIS
jgi:hypothetical protein